MKEILIYLALFGVCSGFVTPPDGLEKCDFGDSLGIVMCIAPVTSLLEDQINLMNTTRARGIRIAGECRNATTCISKIPCATEKKLDKILDLLCDAVDYFSNEFAPCQKKIVRSNPPCMRDAERLLTADVKNPCTVVEKTMGCLESKITDVCGVEYWRPIEKIYRKVENYSFIKCAKPLKPTPESDF